MMRSRVSRNLSALNFVLKLRKGREKSCSVAPGCWSLGVKQAGFTILEIIMVIAIMGIILLAVAPSFNIIPGAEGTAKINILASDIRASYDMAVLHRKTYRLAFDFKSAEYWLEVTEREDFQLSDQHIDREKTPEELKDAAAAFEEDFKEYQKLAGKDVEDAENERTIAPTSALIAAHNKLRPVDWIVVEDSEWSKRSFGPHFMLRAMQAEHYQKLQTYEELQDGGIVYLYFFPQGYVQRAVIYVAPANEDDKAQWDRLTYVVTTNAWEGVAEIESGYKEVDIFRDQKTRP